MPIEFNDDEPLKTKGSPHMSRRAFIAGGAAACALACAGGIWWRLNASAPATRTADEEPESVNEPGRVDTEGTLTENSSKRAYTVGTDIEPGIYFASVEAAAEAGWLSFTRPADGTGALVWPACAQAMRVTVSAQEGDCIELGAASTAHLTAAAPVSELSEMSTHAGLMLVGSDIKAGTYELTPTTDAGAWSVTDFGQTSPTDETHPTLWDKTLARAAQISRAAGLDVSKWPGYIMCEPDSRGDIGLTRETGAASNTDLLGNDAEAASTVAEMAEGDTIVDAYLAWMERLGHTRVSEKTTVELESGMLFAPVMCSCKRV